MKLGPTKKTVILSLHCTENCGIQTQAELPLLTPKKLLFPLPPSSSLLLFSSVFLLHLSLLRVCSSSKIAITTGDSYLCVLNLIHILYIF